VNFLPLNMTAEQLRAGLVDLGRYLYSQSAVDRRRSSFKAQAARGLMVDEDLRDTA